MQDRIKEHDRDIRLARTETSAVSEHARNTGHKPLWNEVKFIDRDPYYYKRRVREAIHIRLHPNNINRDSGVEIPEAWMPTIKKHNNSGNSVTSAPLLRCLLAFLSQSSLTFLLVSLSLSKAWEHISSVFFAICFYALAATRFSRKSC